RESSGGEVHRVYWRESMSCDVAQSANTPFVSKRVAIRTKRHGHVRYHTLKRKSNTSPSCTTYSLPSDRTAPFSRAPFQPPCVTKSLNDAVSARMNPRSKSV